MCFFTRPRVKAAKVAKSDIVAFKLMKNVTLIQASSPFQSKKWDVGTIQSAKLRTKLNYAGERINEGFHCFKTPDDARRYSRECYHKLVPVLIPAGSSYYENDTQFVSNCMVLLGTDLKIFKKVVKKLS